jgi:hypothetical protein
MAIVSAVDEGGAEALYEIPDDVLSKYKLTSAQLTDSVKAQLFPDKDKLTKDDAQGVMATAPSAGGDVEGYAAICRYWIRDGDTIYYSGRGTQDRTIRPRPLLCVRHLTPSWNRGNRGGMAWVER